MSLLFRKSGFTGFLIAFIILLSWCACRGQEVGIQDEILAITEDYNRAWESLNTDSISTYHAEDITYYWRGAKGPTSKSDFEDMLNGLLPRMSAYHHTMIEPHVQVLGEDVAVVSHVYDGDYVSQAGATTNYDGALTYVFHRREGEWKIVHIHESAQCSD